MAFEFPSVHRANFIREKFGSPIALTFCEFAEGSDLQEIFLNVGSVAFNGRFGSGPRFPILGAASQPFSEDLECGK